MFIIPVNKDDYVGRTPYVLCGLIIANALLLAATYWLSSPESVFPRYGFIPAHPHVGTMFSSMFLHAGLWHFIGNMFFLWMFAYRVENTFGRWLFTAVYLACGLGANGLHYVFNVDSSTPCVGASGAISGIVGCYFVLFPKSRFDIEVYFFRFNVSTIPTRTTGAVGAWIAEQTLLGLLGEAVRFSSTAFWAHIGGFATGVAVTFGLLLVAPQLRRRGDQPFIVRHVKGVVLDSHGKPVANARFVLRDDSDEVRTALTSPKGRFQLPDVAEGCYSFTVTAADREPNEGNVVVDRKARFSLPIRIRLLAAEREESLVSLS